MINFIPNKVDLRGHWHVYPVSNSTTDGIEYEIMEIFENGSGRFGGIGGTVNLWKRTILFGGECLVLNFDYQFSGPHLILKQQEYDGIYHAFRCGRTCCDEQKDFFSYQKKVNIDLPIALDTSNFLLNNFSPSLENRLLCGFPKFRYQYNCYGPQTNLVLGNLVSSEQDIPIWNERKKIKTNEEIHHLIKIVIYADKKTRKQRLKESLDMYKALGYKKVFFALRSASVQQNFKIWLKPFDLSNLDKLNKSNDSRTVGEWLNANSTTLN